MTEAGPKCAVPNAIVQSDAFKELLVPSEGKKGDANAYKQQMLGGCKDYNAIVQQAQQRAVSGKAEPPADDLLKKQVSAETAIAMFTDEVENVRIQALVLRTFARCLQGGYDIKESTPKPSDVGEQLIPVIVLSSLLIAGMVAWWIGRMHTLGLKKFWIAADHSTLLIITIGVFGIVIAMSQHGENERRKWYHAAKGRDDPRLVTILLRQGDNAKRVLVPMLDRIHRHILAVIGQVNTAAAASRDGLIDLTQQVTMYDRSSSSIIAQLKMLLDIREQYRILFAPYLDPASGHVDQEVAWRSQASSTFQACILCALVVIVLLVSGLFHHKWIGEAFDERDAWEADMKRLTEAIQELTKPQEEGADNVAPCNASNMLVAFTRLQNKAANFKQLGNTGKGIFLLLCPFAIMFIIFGILQAISWKFLRRKAQPRWNMGMDGIETVVETFESPRSKDSGFTYQASALVRHLEEAASTIHGTKSDMGAAKAPVEHGTVVTWMVAMCVPAAIVAVLLALSYKQTWRVHVYSLAYKSKSGDDMRGWLFWAVVLALIGWIVLVASWRYTLFMM